MKNLKYWFIAVICLQVLFLAAEAARYQIRLSTGTIVYLKVVPVDPRSVFMGNYFDLAFDISTLPKTMLSGNPKLDLNGGYPEVWVALEPSTPYAKAVAVLGYLPQDQPGRVYLKANASTYSWSKGSLNLRYGLERYYIPESRKSDAEQLSYRLQNPHPPVITVEVSVDGSGVGYLKRILVDGKPLGY